MKQAELLNQAKVLRRRGYSFKEIGELLKISKSTAYLWTNGVIINKTAKNRLKQISDIGRLKGNQSNRKKREARWQSVADKTITFKENLSDYSIDECKVILAMLYWGEGAKTGKRMVFVNSDPGLIKTYLFLLRRSYCVKEDKLRTFLHLHSYHDQDEMITYWSGITGIGKNHFSIYSKPNTTKSYKDGYKGCISIRYSDVNIFDEIILIIERFHKSIK